MRDCSRTNLKREVCYVQCRSAGASRVSPIFRPIVRQSQVKAKSARVSSSPAGARLPANVVRYRDQKICSYCRHAITDDPYFRRQSYTAQILRLRLLRVMAVIINFFSPRSRETMERRQQQIVLPGWVRCRNRRCGQLYHANCWHHLAAPRRCFRCGSHEIERVA